MPRMILLICSGICLLDAADINAQKSIQRVVANQQNEQKLWQLSQLPKNSVVYKFNSNYSGYHSYSYSFSRQHEKLPSVLLPNTSIYMQPKKIRSRASALLAHKSSLHYYDLFQQWLYRHDKKTL
jgi:hypothetical protein